MGNLENRTINKTLAVKHPPNMKSFLEGEIAGLISVQQKSTYFVDLNYTIRIIAYGKKFIANVLRLNILNVTRYSFWQWDAVMLTIEKCYTNYS